MLFCFDEKKREIIDYDFKIIENIQKGVRYN